MTLVKKTIHLIVREEEEKKKDSEVLLSPSKTCPFDLRTLH
jgi:hypothetical protein